MKKILSVFLIFISFSELYSNTSDTIVVLNNSDTIVLKKLKLTSITDTTYDCTVITGSRNVYKDVNLFGLKDSTVKILKGAASRKLNISDIRTIKFNARGFWQGAAIGGGIGFLIGAIAGAQGVNLGSDGSSEGSVGEAIGIGAILGVPFALIGGGLGALFAEDRFYDLSNLDFVTKQRVIGYLIKEYSDR